MKRRNEEQMPANKVAKQRDRGAEGLCNARAKTKKRVGDEMGKVEERLKRKRN